jgi:hypothetical protein
MTRVVVHAKLYAMDQGPILFYPCNFQDFPRKLSRNPENDPFGVDIIFSITSLIVSLFPTLLCAWTKTKGIWIDLTWSWFDKKLFHTITKLWFATYTTTLSASNIKSVLEWTEGL